MTNTGNRKYFIIVGKTLSFFAVRFFMEPCFDFLPTTKFFFMFAPTVSLILEYGPFLLKNKDSDTKGSVFLEVIFITSTRDHAETTTTNRTTTFSYYRIFSQTTTLWFLRSFQPFRHSFDSFYQPHAAQLRRLENFPFAYSNICCASHFMGNRMR